MKNRWSCNKWLNMAAIAAGLLFFAYIMYRAPFTSDDLMFSKYARQSAADVVKYALHYGNGRIAGNLLALAMTSNSVLRIAGKALLSIALIILASRRAAGEYSGKLIAAFLLITAASPKLFSEIFTWTSGFANYVPPVVCTLLCLQLLRSSCAEGEKRNRVLKTVLIAVTAFVGQLFVEHVTVVNILIALAAVLFAFKTRNRQQAATGSIMLIFSSLGAAVMILIPRVFYQPGNQVEKYGRAFQVGTFSELFRSLYSNLMSLSTKFIENVVLLVALSALCWAVLELTKGNWKNARLNTACKAFCLLFASFVIINTLLGQNIWYGRFTAQRSLIIVMLLIGLMSVLLCCAAHIRDRAAGLTVAACVLLTMASVAPLLVVTPTVNRCLFFAYCCLCVAALTLLGCVMELLSPEKKAMIEQTAASFSVMLMLCLAAIFTNASDWNAQRDAGIRTQMEQGAKEIIIDRCPYDYVYENRTPWSYRYQFYYLEEGDIAFEYRQIDPLQ